MTSIKSVKCWTDPSSKYFYGKDHLGSIRSVTNNSQGSVASFDYDPYGRRTQLSGTLAVDFGYTGHYQHASGLVLTLYRAYDPSLGRWISRDPIGIAGGINLYGYVEGNRINRVDSKGQVYQVTVPIALILGVVAMIAINYNQAQQDGVLAKTITGTPITAYNQYDYYLLPKVVQEAITQHEMVHLSQPFLMETNQAELEGYTMEYMALKKALDNPNLTRDEKLEIEDRLKYDSKKITQYLDALKKLDCP